MRLLTYNIHKGFAAANTQFILDQIKKTIKTVHADVVCLQEVLGHHDEHGKKLDWPTTSQFEFLADQTWTHYAYGKNAVYDEGHHGNAILSKFPIESWHNEDVSYSKYERRGLLHTVLECPKAKVPIHIICVHLGLFEKDRRHQVLALAKKIKASVPENEAVVVAGDFNDWRENVSDLLIEKLNLKEAFLEVNGKHAATFPAFFPMLALDRVYYKNLSCVSVEVLKSKEWRRLSDHLPMCVDFQY